MKLRKHEVFLLVLTFVAWTSKGVNYGVGLSTVSIAGTAFSSTNALEHVMIYAMSTSSVARLSVTFRDNSFTLNNSLLIDGYTIFASSSIPLDLSVNSNTFTGSMMGIQGAFPKLSSLSISGNSLTVNTPLDLLQSSSGSGSLACIVVKNFYTSSVSLLIFQSNIFQTTFSGLYSIIGLQFWGVTLASNSFLTLEKNNFVALSSSNAGDSIHCVAFFRDKPLLVLQFSVVLISQNYFQVECGNIGKPYGVSFHVTHLNVSNRSVLSIANNYFSQIISSAASGGREGAGVHFWSGSLYVNESSSFLISSNQMVNTVGNNQHYYSVWFTTLSTVTLSSSRFLIEDNIMTGTAYCVRHVLLTMTGSYFIIMNNTMSLSLNLGGAGYVGMTAPYTVTDYAGDLNYVIVADNKAIGTQTQLFDTLCLRTQYISG